MQFHVGSDKIYFRRSVFDVTIIGGGGDRSMPNIKSASKRVLIEKQRNARNRAAKSALKTTLKKFDAVVAGGDREAAAAT